MVPLEPTAMSAIVTGAGRGLGAAIAKRLAADGWRVVVNDIDGDAADEVVSSILKTGGAATPGVADITDADSVAELVRLAEDEVAPLGVVVLNATGPQPDCDFDTLTWAEIADQLDFFVKSPMLITAAAAPLMAVRGVGRIVHVDSEVVSKVPLGRADYVTAKSAQLGFVRSSALELAPDGITVNTVAPGFIPVERHASVPTEIFDGYRQTIPTGDFGSVDDIAAAVSFFASPEAQFVTGQRLIVDGGRHLT